MTRRAMSCAAIQGATRSTNAIVAFVRSTAETVHAAGTGPQSMSLNDTPPGAGRGNSATLLSPDRLMRAAERASGLTDWGEPAFLPALDRLCRSAVDDARFDAA